MNNLQKMIPQQVDPKNTEAKEYGGNLQAGSDLYDKPCLDAVLKDYSYYTRG